jgi:hypothetical protein
MDVARKESVMKKPFLLLLGVLAAAALACSLSGSATPTDPNVLFQDNFSDTNSGWDQVNTASGVTDYANGAYRIWVDKTQYDAWANPGKSFTGDVIVEVDATKKAGPDQNDFGVICRYVDISNFYFLQVTSDGYAVIGKQTDGKQSYISGEKFEQAAAVHQGDATNHIRADCIGDTLTLYVNGDRTLSATDSDHTSGDVGLIAGTFDTVGTDILFDNFVVKKP